MTDVALDCLNDTTVCFVPAKEECIDFKFYYCTSTGIDMTSEVTFFIKDNTDNIVYSQPVGVVNWPGPGSPSIYSVYLRWDGRNNWFNSGHLADPDNGPYHAWVEANVGPTLTTYTTAFEDFFVVPSIDSILLTHTPSYPPPGANETTNLYAIIRGKVDDDALIPDNNYKYYHAPDIFAPNPIFVWDGGDHSYHFHDLPTGPPEEPDEHWQQYYYENNNTRALELREWNEYLWGPLTYNWYVYHDYRYRQYGENQVLYHKIDTSGTWGHDWKVVLNAPDNWEFADEVPFMRLLTAAEIINNRNVYHVQDNIFAKDQFAHKVIFGDNIYYAGYDIVDWAKTHIGVAYQSHSGLEKNPYRRIECSGLVTATRIQDIGPGNNEVYRIGHIEAREWDAGEYNFRGEDLDLQVDEITGQEVGRGSLITFRKTGSTDVVHIAIVEDALYDMGRRRFVYCCMINARGWRDIDGDGDSDPEPQNGRVKYEDLMDDFETGWTFKFFNFAD